VFFRGPPRPSREKKKTGAEKKKTKKRGCGAGGEGGRGARKLGRKGGGEKGVFPVGDKKKRVGIKGLGRRG